MGINQVSLNLLQHQKQHDKNHRLNRVFNKYHEHPDSTSHERPKNRNQCSKCNQNPNQQRIRKPKHSHRHNKHTAQNHSLHTLPRQETRECIISQRQHFHSRLTAPSPYKCKQHLLCLQTQFFFLEQDINRKYKCNKESG